MSAPKTLFNPQIQPNNTLSGVQKYLLRVILGWAGKTVLHRGRIFELLETRGSLRQLSPLVESDLAESDRGPFWVPRRALDRRKFAVERLEKRRRHFTIGKVEGDPRPAHHRRQRLYSRFPDIPYLHYLVTELGYPLDAARAAFARPLIQSLPDKRTTSSRGVSRGENLYIPESVSRRTRTGGGFSEKQARRGLSKMRTNGRVGQALFEIVYKRRSTKEVAQEFDLTPEKLYVYASRLRGHIRQQQHPAPAFAPSRTPVPDLHDGENLVPYLQ